MQQIMEFRNQMQQSQLEQDKQQAAALRDYAPQDVAFIKSTETGQPAAPAVDPNAFVYRADKYEKDRQDIIAKKGFGYNKILEMRLDEPTSKNVREMLENQHGPTPVPFNLSPEYKTAQDSVDKINEKSRTTQVLGTQLDEMRKYLDAGNKQGALTFAKEVMAKTVNSLISPDAVSIGEAFMRYPALLNAPEMAMLGDRKNGLTNTILTRLSGMPADELKKLNVLGALKKAYNADPEAFYEATAHAYNASAIPFNNELHTVIERTNPKYAFDMGVRPLAMFEVRSADPVEQLKNSEDFRKKYADDPKASQFVNQFRGYDIQAVTPTVMRGGNQQGSFNLAYPAGHAASVQPATQGPAATPSGPVYGPVRTYGPTPFTVVK
jgi:hypothetical protein